MKLFIFLFVLYIGWNVYRLFDLSEIFTRERFDQFLDYSQQQAEKDLCQDNMKPRYGYVGKGWGFLDCYIPKEDTGKMCVQASNCQSGQCLVKDESLIEKLCTTRIESQSYACTNISGECTDGGTIEAGLYISTKDHVMRKKYY